MLYKVAVVLAYVVPVFALVCIWVLELVGLCEIARRTGEFSRLGYGVFCFGMACLSVFAVASSAGWV